MHSLNVWRLNGNGFKIINLIKSVKNLNGTDIIKTCIFVEYLNCQYAN